MLPDFFNAHQRHFYDAECLYNNLRWPNADQLYAFSAECGLKCLMQLFGMSIDSSGLPSKEDRLHADGIWSRYEAYRAGMGASGYALPQTNPFCDWNSSQRYAHDSNFNQTLVDTHKKGAGIVKNLIEKAILEGRLR